MTIDTMLRRDPNVVRSTVPESKLQWLGRAGSYEYATRDGREYAVDVHPSHPGDYNRGPGEIVVMRIARETVDGSTMEHHQPHRAWQVATGTYAALLEKANKRTSDKPMRAWDKLANLAVPERSPAGIIAHLASHGVELTLARGRLVARSRTLIRGDDRELVERAEELLTAALAGKTVMCSWCGEPAVTVVFPKAPMCPEHATP